MAIKVVVLFQDVTQGTVQSPSIGLTLKNHIGGWSEYMYGPDNVADCVNALTVGFGGIPAFIPARAALLPATSSIIGFRLYQPGVGKGQSFSRGAPGNPSYPTDVPQMGLLCKTLNLGFGVSRRWTLRGIPDQFVVLGEFAPDNTYRQLLLNYFFSLQNFSFLVLNAAQQDDHIQSISTLGVVQLIPPLAFAPQPGDFVRIIGTRDAVGVRYSFGGRITAANVALQQYTLSQAPSIPLVGGRLRIANYIFAGFQVSTSGVNRIVVRKVGRPFEQYRGRRSKKRRPV